MTLQKDPVQAAFQAPESEHERFLYAVSHDLQEPLRMVSSFLKLLDTRTGDSLDEDSRKYLHFSLENAERMKGMIYALVELSRIGRETEAPAPMNLAHTLEELSAFCIPAALSDNFKLSASAPYNVLMAPGHALKLLRILLDNSVHHHPAGRPLHIQLKAVEAEDGYVQFNFSDNGAGIPEAFVGRAFEMFACARRDGQRLGSGLALAKAIVEKTGGKINVRSTEGLGTIVSFTLPTAP
jgi:signal transduction histidine kinase